MQLPMRLVAACLALFTATAHADWNYRSETDKMTGKEMRAASAHSTNSLSLDFPYRGENHGHLQVRQHPKYGLDVIFAIDKGQLLCRSYERCKVMIRFDAADPQAFAAVGSADNDSTTIFLRDTKRFIAQASKAKRILVQATVYKGGEPILEFDTPAPLKWPAGTQGKP